MSKQVSKLFSYKYLGSIVHNGNLVAHVLEHLVSDKMVRAVPVIECYVLTESGHIPNLTVTDNHINLPKKHRIFTIQEAIAKGVMVPPELRAWVGL